jgi:hypothetical protein
LALIGRRALRTGMTIRLLLALLAAALALPAVAPAACHDAAQPAPSAHHATMPGHPAPHGDAEAVHGCIGCIPPSDWLRAPVVAAIRVAPPVRVARVTTLDIGRGSPPALPPPRRG